MYIYRYICIWVYMYIHICDPERTTYFWVLFQGKILVNPLSPKHQRVPKAPPLPRAAYGAAQGAEEGRNCIPAGRASHCLDLSPMEENSMWGPGTGAQRSCGWIPGMSRLDGALHKLWRCPCPWNLYLRNGWRNCFWTWHLFVECRVKLAFFLPPHFPPYKQISLRK